MRGCQFGLHGLVMPERGRLALDEASAAAPVVRDRQIAQDAGAQQAVEEVVGPAQARPLGAGQLVDAARDAGAAEPTEDGADQQARAHRQSAGCKVGLQAGQRAGQHAAEQRGPAFVDRLLRRVGFLHAFAGWFRSREPSRP